VFVVATSRFPESPKSSKSRGREKCIERNRRKEKITLARTLMRLTGSGQRLQRGASWRIVPETEAARDKNAISLFLYYLSFAIRPIKMAGTRRASAGVRNGANKGDCNETELEPAMKLIWEKEEQKGREKKNSARTGFCFCPRKMATREWLLSWLPFTRDIIAGRQWPNLGRTEEWTLEMDRHYTQNGKERGRGQEEGRSPPIGLSSEWSTILRHRLQSMIVRGESVNTTTSISDIA